MGGVLIWISLCNLCVLCVFVVIGIHDTTTTEAQRTQRLHREEAQTRTLLSIFVYLWLKFDWSARVDGFVNGVRDFDGH